MRIHSSLISEGPRVEFGLDKLSCFFENLGQTIQLAVNTSMPLVCVQNCLTLTFPYKGEIFPMKNILKIIQEKAVLKCASNGLTKLIPFTNEICSVGV